MCRAAIRSRRTAPCGRSAPTLVEHGDDFQAAREEAVSPRRGATGSSSCRRSIRIWCWGLRPMRSSCCRARPDLDVLYVPIGQGSGICGCILARDLLGSTTEIVGVQSTLAPSYALSFAAGSVVTTETSNTLADGMATRIPDPDALAIIRKGAARIVQVTDDEIGAAIRAYWTDTHNLAEGAGAAPLAAALQERDKHRGKRGRPDPERRQYRFRPVPPLGRGSPLPLRAERRIFA